MDIKDSTFLVANVRTILQPNDGVLIYDKAFYEVIVCIEY